VEESNVSYITPDSLSFQSGEVRDRWYRLQDEAEDLYLEAILGGMKKEDARYILPQGCTTSLRLTGNFQMWKDIISNRTTKHAQWEIRDVFTQANNLLNLHAPNVFPYIQPGA
jgi:thymidylate synthase (FAD)